MRYISLFCLVINFACCIAPLKTFIIQKIKKFCNAKNILPKSTTFSHFPKIWHYRIFLYFANRSFSSDVTAAILVYQNNEMAAILVYGTGISSFLFKYFVLFHHPTGATDHVSENDLLLVFVPSKIMQEKKLRVTMLLFQLYEAIGNF